MFSNLSSAFRVAQAIELFVLIFVSLFSVALPAQSTATTQEHEQRANEYLHEKKPKLAMEEFRAVLAADPNNLEAQANLGVLLFFQKDYGDAIPYLRQAIAQQSELTKIRALLGLAEMYAGQTEEARADLEASVPKLDETEFRIQVGLALVELDDASRDLYRAADVIALLREGAPTDPRVLFAAYRIATEQAGEAMLSLSLVAPDSALMHEAMAQELERALDYPGAIANLRKAAALDPALPSIHYELGEALLEDDDVKLQAEAGTQFKLAIEQNPRDAKSALALGNLAKASGNTQEAMKYYSQAFAVDPQLPGAALAIADAEVDKGEYAAAALKLEQVVNEDPSNILAHYRLFTIYKRLKRPEDAKRELEAFQRYNQLKKKMQAIYKEMRQHVPDQEEQKLEKQGTSPG